MRPTIALDVAIVAANLQAWRKFAGVPVRPVLKANAYNWGLADVVPALDPYCDAYCVADLEELHDLRRFSAHPAILLAPVKTDDLEEVFALDGVPVVETFEDVAATTAYAARTSRRARVRVGLMPAAGFSGVDLARLDQLAPALGACPCDLELFTHITSDTNLHQVLGRVKQAQRMIRGAGGKLLQTDVFSTAPLAREGVVGDTVRVGAGLYGATFGGRVPGVRCALRVSAPVVRVERVQAGTRVGYGDVKVEENGYVLVARCGYADGLPKGLAGHSDILSVGMQYVTQRTSNEHAVEIELLNASVDLDGFAARAGRDVHEIITSFGSAKTSTVSV
ncbi:MAG: alanine racemase [Candidatus Eremiobacteraeota bacterium]|nr:alanine racemase [Candidatus Eremiobacteraeota bacterium]